MHGFQEFKQYDYGSDALNTQHYNSTVVPKIDISKIEKAQQKARLAFCALWVKVYKGDSPC